MDQIEAFKVGKQLRDQKETWPEIARTLSKMGYKSPLTKRPLTPIGVRHFITHFDAQDKKADVEEEKRILVGEGTATLKEQLEALRSIMQMRVPPTKKVALAKTILE